VIKKAPGAKVNFHAGLEESHSAARSALRASVKSAFGLSQSGSAFPQRAEGDLSHRRVAALCIRRGLRPSPGCTTVIHQAPATFRTRS
jgi:hypothetical protein